MVTRKVAAWNDIYVLDQETADPIVEALRAKGFRADTEASGACSRTPDGHHIHYRAVRVVLTPAQAKKLAGLK